MEMCYDGALVMPSNYAVMEEDEMVYVEGGKAIARSTVEKAVNIGVSALLLAVGIGYGISAILWFVKNSVKGLVVAGLKRAIVSTLASFGFTAASGIYGLLNSINGNWTIGYGVAWLIDNKFDKKSKRGNGYCFG